MDHYKQNKRCPVCSRVLNGIFNTALEIIAKMKANAQNTKKNKKTRIVIGEKREGAPATENDEEEQEENGLDGVEFGTAGKNQEEDEDKQKRRLERLAKEFKNSVAQQKEKFASETDWHY